ncbi:MAG: Txe/YoeB family addiction module toxin [Methylococcales bacterium]|nr:Txe/YoeB family addiction module toxin [Methylococcales bacterium]
MSWQVILSRQATKDAKRISQANLKPQAQKLLTLLTENPYTTPPPYEKLVGNLQGFYSRRISIQHRLIYRIIEAEKVVHILRMWTHYE